MTDPRSEIEALGRALADDLADYSDEEILELARAKGYGSEVAQQVQGQADAAISSYRRAALIEARRKLDGPREQFSSSPDVIDIEVMRSRLRKAMRDTGGEFGKITLAARDGKGVPDTDIEELYNDALLLGIIRPDGDLD